MFVATAHRLQALLQLHRGILAAAQARSLEGTLMPTAFAMTFKALSMHSRGLAKQVCIKPFELKQYGRIQM